MKKLKILFFFSISFLLLVFIPFLVAGMGGPAAATGCMGMQVCAPIPIDGGIGLLIAAGVGYGLKKLYDVNKASKN